MNAVDLRSDTKSRPTDAMRRAIASAEVGDEQSGEDPTTRDLEERVAALLGKEAAVFTPSGTMCNAIGFRLHLRPGGDEVVLDRNSHPVRFEAGGVAQLSGALVHPLDTECGIFSASDLEGAIRAPDHHAPRTRLVSIEQTTNLGGGRIWPLETIDAVTTLARGAGLRTHMDGARLLNAVVASGVSAARFARDFDTAWIDLSKGLGAPVGAVLGASAELVEEARRYKQLYGGAMRQSGIIAAAGVYALEHHVERLVEDHENARLLAEGLAEIQGIALDPASVETNIVAFGVADAPRFCAALAEHGVLMGAIGANRVRAVTHLDVDTEGVKRALSAAGVLAR